AVAAIIAAGPATAAAHPTPDFVGLAGGGGNVPIINGEPPSGEESGLLSDDDELSIRRLRSVRGGVTSGDEVIPVAAVCNAAIRRTLDSSSIFEYPFLSGKGPQDIGTFDV